MGNSGNIIDTNLIPGNIKDGVPIFGVVGTLASGQGIGAFDDTITQYVPMGASPGLTHDGSAGFHFHNGTNYFFAIFSAGLRTGGDYLLLSVFAIEKATAKVRTITGMALTTGSFTLENAIAIDDALGTIRIQTTTGVFVYYSFTANSVGLANPGGAFIDTAYLDYTTTFGGAATTNNFATEISTTYNGKTYALQSTDPNTDPQVRLSIS